MWQNEEGGADSVIPFFSEGSSLIPIDVLGFELDSVNHSNVKAFIKGNNYAIQYSSSSGTSIGYAYFISSESYDLTDKSILVLTTNIDMNSSVLISLGVRLVKEAESIKPAIINLISESHAKGLYTSIYDIKEYSGKYKIYFQVGAQATYGYGTGTGGVTFTEANYTNFIM